jgi:very-short-patch-repair endonuclease
MAPKRRYSRVWELAGAQHGVVSRSQLLALDFSTDAIGHRLAKGRLHRIHRGVHAVGRPELTQEGVWMAAVLLGGPDAYLSHVPAAAHWGICRPPGGPVDISLIADVFRHPPGIRVHRRPTRPPGDVTTHHNIPATCPICTLIDLATVLTPNRLEATVNEADALDLVDPETLRAALEERNGQRGVRVLRELLDRHTFRLTESELERRFLRIVRAAGRPLPETQAKLAGRTDFHWPDLGLVVETDGLRYHRTPSRQAGDNRRMQAHAAAGRTAVRFSHYEIRYEGDRLAGLLAKLVRNGESPSLSSHHARGGRSLRGPQG